MKLCPFKINHFLLIIFVMTSGCKKVIQLKVSEIPPKYVIEGNLSDWVNDCSVVITSSIGLNDPLIFEGVSKAEVTIQEDQATPVVLHEISQGNYSTNLLTARPEHQYTLSVKIGEEKFESTVTVPKKVNLDSLYIIDFDAFGGVRKFANVIFQDPEGIPNNYRFLQFKNKVQNSNIFVFNDNFSDGRLINTFLPFFDDSEVQKIKSGDTVMVEMQCIDPSVYLFFNSLSISSTGGSVVVAPGYPGSIIRGGVL